MGGKLHKKFRSDVKAGGTHNYHHALKDYFYFLRYPITSFRICPNTQLSILSHFPYLETGRARHKDES